MEAILNTFTELKLEQPKHRARFFNYMTSKSVFAYNEACFFLCARDYIFNPTPQKLAAFPRIFLRKGSTLEVNISNAHYSKACGFFHGSNSISINSFGNSKLGHTVRTFKDNKTPGAKANGAANYNLTTKALDYISRAMSRDQTDAAIVTIRNDGSLPVFSEPDQWYLSDVVQELKGVWCADPLKELV